MCNWERDDEGVWWTECDKVFLGDIEDHGEYCQFCGTEIVYPEGLEAEVRFDD